MKLDFDPTLFMIPGISCCGKTTMARELASELNESGIKAGLVVPFTTRPRRAERGEINGIDYRFVSKKEFETRFVPKITKDPQMWDVSVFGEHHYFNRVQDTVPTLEEPVKVLPISIGSLGEMIDRYKGTVPRIIVLPIVVEPSAVEPWHELAERQRPGRKITNELDDQNYLSVPGIQIATPYSPSWKLGNDKHEFVNYARQLILNK